ncbi:MAG: hypothetical protein BECKG1743E_GA0114224_100361, partial [Candidatus Kentron sp. G]
MHTARISKNQSATDYPATFPIHGHCTAKVLGFACRISGPCTGTPATKEEISIVTARVISGVASHIQVEETEALHVSRIALMVRGYLRSECVKE